MQVSRVRDRAGKLFSCDDSGHAPDNFVPMLFRDYLTNLPFDLVFEVVAFVTVDVSGVVL